MLPCTRDGFLGVGTGERTRRRERGSRTAWPPRLNERCRALQQRSAKALLPGRPAFLTSETTREAEPALRQLVSPGPASVS